MKAFLALLVLAVGGFSTPCLAGSSSGFAVSGSGLDSASSDALQKTMSLLNSDIGRLQATHQSADAQAVDAQVKSLGGNPTNVDAIYGLASDVMNTVVERSGGDVTKMMKILQQAKDNPKGFYERYFSAEEKAKLRQLSKTISNSSSTVPSSTQ